MQILHCKDNHRGEEECRKSRLAYPIARQHDVLLVKNGEHDHSADRRGNRQSRWYQSLGNEYRRSCQTHPFVTQHDVLLVTKRYMISIMEFISETVRSSRHVQDVPHHSFPSSPHD